MRIDRLTVRNYRCFAEQSFVFHPQFNVLIGDNGSGKTTVLEALAVAVGSWLVGMGNRSSRPIRATDVRLAGRTVGEEFTFEPQFPAEVAAWGQVHAANIAWSRALTSAQGKTTLSAARDIQQLSKDAEKQVQAGESITLPVIAYYGAGRLWLPPRNAEAHGNGGDNGARHKLSRLEGYANRLEERVSLNDLNWWLERQDRIAYQEGREPILYRTVRQAMRRLVEQAEDVIFDNRRLEIVVRFKDREPQPFANLSDGERNMLALAGDLAVRMARLNPQLGDQVLCETPGVVLIDELDLHLHPNWQRHIVRDLMQTFPKVQFIATTHSPQIISEVQPECLIQLMREGDRVSIQMGTQAYGLDSNWILEHLMNAPSRPEPAQHMIDRIEQALEEGHLDTSRAYVAELRRMLHGDDSEVARLEATINNLEFLADEVDTQAA